MFCRAAIHAAAFGDHVECLQMLLKHKAQIDIIDSLGRSPLMLASQLGQFNTVGKSPCVYIPCTCVLVYDNVCLV